MTNVEELLAAVSEEHPCGVDISSDPRLQQIEMALEGASRNRALDLELKEETKPKWHDYVTTCEEMWAEGKHLSVALLLCLGWLNVEGLTGFRQGLLLIRWLIVDHWETFYPAVDEEDLRQWPKHWEGLFRAIVIWRTSSILRKFQGMWPSLFRIRGTSLWMDCWPRSKKSKALWANLGPRFALASVRAHRPGIRWNRI